MAEKSRLHVENNCEITFSLYIVTRFNLFNQLEKNCSSSKPVVVEIIVVFATTVMGESLQ